MNLNTNNEMEIFEVWQTLLEELYLNNMFDEASQVEEILEKYMFNTQNKNNHNENY